MTEFPRLYAVVDVEICARVGREPLDVARAFLAGGARLMQLRAKTLDGRGFLALARAATEAAHAAGARLIVNDRVDLALLAAADGVHVGQDDLSPEDVRRLAGPGMIVGLSTHTTSQIEAALAAPISYLAIGPVFGTVTKATGYEPVGTTAVREARRRAERRAVPVVAIGGITIDTAAAVLDAGAASLAIISDLLIDDPEKRVRQYLSALEAAEPPV